jgi:signal peptidase I
MNPQADNDPDALKRSLNQAPQARPLNIPARPSGMHDIDDSAFEPVDEPRPQIVRPTPIPQQREPIQPSPVTMPAAPAPQFEPAPQPAPAPAPQPVAAPQPAPRIEPPTPEPMVPPAPIAPPAPVQPLQPVQPVPQAPPAPVAPVAPVPVPQQPVLPQPQPAAPVQPPKLPPMPVTPVEHAPNAQQTAFNPGPAPAHIPQSPQLPGPAATPAAGTPSVSYQPPTPHLDKALIERIDETPQQNSKDIESLIDHNHRLHRLKSFASFLAFCAGVVVAAFLINQFVFQSYYVDGTSMTPTLQNDDRLIIDKVEKSFAGLQGKPYIPSRGQVVVLDSSIVGFNGREEQLIKRVIGLPGDTITIRDGTVTIKNKDNPDGFNADRQLGLMLSETYVESPQEWTIEENQLFVMGDNRAQNGSYDSRAFGPVESEKIVGRLWARIMPFEKAQVY